MFLKKKFIFWILPLLFAGFAEAHPSTTYDGKPSPKVSTEKIKELEGVGIDEKLGSELDLSLTFKDENGRSVQLSEYFKTGLPVVMSPVYYSCASLCNYHLNGIFESFQGLDWGAGQKFIYLAISFDPKENTALAKMKRESYLKQYGRPNWNTEGIHFLTADEQTLRKWTGSIGFKYHWEADTQQWAHGSAAVIASPAGKIVRYLPGIMFESKDLRFAINESASGHMGTFVDALMLYCFKYNPTQSKYTLAAFNLVKLGGILMMIILAIWLIPFWKKNLHKDLRREQTSARSS